MNICMMNIIKLPVTEFILDNHCVPASCSLPYFCVLYVYLYMQERKKCECEGLGSYIKLFVAVLFRLGARLGVCVLFPT